MIWPAAVFDTSPYTSVAWAENCIAPWLSSPLANTAVPCPAIRPSGAIGQRLQELHRAAQHVHQPRVGARRSGYRQRVSSRDAQFAAGGVGQRRVDVSDAGDEPAVCHRTAARQSRRAAAQLDSSHVGNWRVDDECTVAAHEQSSTSLVFERAADAQLSSVVDNVSGVGQSADGERSASQFERRRRVDVDRLIDDEVLLGAPT